jgi:hypothetical protein
MFSKTYSQNWFTAALLSDFLIYQVQLTIFVIKHLHMIGEDLITASGNITKEEELVNVDHHIIPGTLVLESLHPYPGYHGDNIPGPREPDSIYLVTAVKYDGDLILRASKKVLKNLSFKFDASFGYTLIPPATYHFIRLLGLDCFDCIGRIQESYAREGIEFMKTRTVNGNALIRIQKYFSFKKIDDKIFQDIDNPMMYYFEISERPDWAFFKKITFYIRGNLDNYSFDSALGAIYLREIHDIVRIFGKDLTLEQLNFIRKKYLYELSHPDHLG